MRRIKLKLTFGLLLTCFISQAQFANDWIDFNQRYFKIPVEQDGIYTITRNQMIAVGIPVSAINADRFQMFRRGEEIAIRVEKNGDNTVSKIHFYGKRNDGKGDTDLYDDPTDQPHLLQSLYSEAASYFLTWKLTGVGRRMTVDNDLTPSSTENYHWAEDLRIERSSFEAGQKYGSGNDISSGQYALGEGWSGASQGKNGIFTYTFTLTNENRSAGALPQLEVLLAGRNNLDHRMEISVQNDAINTVLDTVDGFSGKEVAVFSSAINWSQVNSSNQIVVNLKVLGYPSTDDRLSISYIRLKYPQNFSLSTDQNKLFQLRESAGGSLYVGLVTPESTAAIYDVTDPVSPVIRGTQYTSGTLYFVADNPSVSRQIRAVGAEVNVSSLTEKLNDPIDPAGSDYLIITHSNLRTAASDGLDPVQAFATYRESEYNVHIADIQGLYDQFNYGDPSPLAIKNYLKYAVSETTVKHVFLIGKGVTYEKNPYRSTSTASVHYIPTYGLPGSDVLFTVGLTGTSPNPELSIGRLNATNSESVKIYLDKIKQMESLGYNELWRKNLIHLSGGTTSGELTIFRNAIVGFSETAQSDFLGGKSFNYSKEAASTLEFIDVVDIVNEGVSMITFFGHSSSQATDVEIGLANAENGFTNAGKYPVIYQNGCNGGAIFENVETFGDNWVFAPNLGGIGVIAHSDLALSSNLRRFTNMFYDNIFGTESTFGLSLGEAMLLTQNTFLNLYGTADVSLSQVYGMLLEGDPAYRIFAAPSPDYEITEEDISASPINTQRILSTAESFSLDINIRNYGRTVSDSLLIQVERTLADGSSITYTQLVERPLYEDTVSFVITNDQSRRNDGNNLFVISLDPDNNTTELDETNNTASFELYIPKGNTIHLFPINFGVTSSQEVDFMWQPANLLEDDRAYSFELDTVQSYSSSFHFETQVAGSSLLKMSYNLVGIPDSTTVFWRTRFAEMQEGEDTSWVEASFTYVESQPSGWGQFRNGQVRENAVSGMVYNEAAGRWEFQETQLPVYVSTHSSTNNQGFGYNDFQVLLNGIDVFSSDSPSFDSCATNTINAVIFDKETAVPRLPQDVLGSNYSVSRTCGREPLLINNFEGTEVTGATDYLDLLISSMETGDGILLFSMDSVKFSDWDAQLKSSLASVGVSGTTINALEDGQPVIFLGKKGIAEGEAIEIVDNGSGLPAKQQVLELDDEVVGVYSSGTINVLIGPAKTWNDFNYQVDQLGSDNIYLDFKGVQQSGQTQSLIFADKTDEINIAAVDASTYPYIDLTLEIQDNDNQLPTQLRYWAMDYVPGPEGILITDNKEKESLDEGAVFERNFSFVNISDQDFQDSISISSRLTNISSASSLNLQQLVVGPAAGDSAHFTVSFSTLNRTAENNLSVTAEPREPEQYDLNNTLNLSRILDVEEDNSNPVLDVTFDGAYILDGDIVSPSPRIFIKFVDDNQYLIKDDTVGMNIWLKSPCETCDYERVYMSDAKVSYSPATTEGDFEIEYLPGPLEDGVYHLRVQGEDESGNESGVEPYEISFEVINESTITHFYPYPNPFSTSTRFVFTLTGSEIPDQIKIQIMTISGRVVREITQEEIGPLKIGNNITQYAWDGRDEFGDRLANGVYLYKVFIRQSGEKMKHRATSADRAFKNGFGKIYLLR